MCADGVDAVFLDAAVTGDDEVCGLSLETLDQVVVADGVGFQPHGGLLLIYINKRGVRNGGEGCWGGDFFFCFFVL